MSEVCAECLTDEGQHDPNCSLAPTPLTVTRDPSIYDEAVREWVARMIRKDPKLTYLSRDNVRDVHFGFDGGWWGTDVTPGDPDVTVIAYQWCRTRGGSKWEDDYVAINDKSLAEMIQECLAIHQEILDGPPRPPPAPEPEPPSETEVLAARVSNLERRLNRFLGLPEKGRS